MDIYGSMFFREGGKIEVHPGAPGRPIVVLDTIGIHFPDEAKLVELQDHIAAYLAKDDGELDPAAEACAAVGETAAGDPVSFL